jgi:hypothetical protein
MKISNVKEFVNSHFLHSELRTPILLWGPPGVGKSSCVEQICDEQGIGFKKEVLSQLTYDEVRGVVTIVKDESGVTRAVWTKSPIFPDVNRDGEKGILFFDDMLHAAPSVLKSIMQLLLEHRLGDYELPENWYIIAASNREEDYAGVSPLLSPVANRFIHLEVEVDIDEWVSWAIDEEIESMITSFLRFRPDMLFQMPELNQRTFPTPRSWHFVSDVLKSSALAGEPAPEEAISGAVGDGARREFHAYQKSYADCERVCADVFDGVFSSSKTLMAKKRLDVIYAVGMRLIYELNRKRRGIEELIVEYACVLAQMYPEAALSIIRDATKIDRGKITKAKSFKKLAKQFKELTG